MPQAIALDEDMKRCAEEALEMERNLAAAREHAEALARENAANENTLPPVPRLDDVIRRRDYDHAVCQSRRKRRNRALTIRMSLLLLLMAGVAAASLILWAMRYWNGR